MAVRADCFDLYGIRKRTYSCLSSTYYTYLDYRYGAMCEAFMLGNRNHIGDSIKQIFSDSGIYHILAISGLHISVLLYIFLFLFRRTRWMLVPVMFILAFFNFLVGLKASLLRASIMMISAAMSQSWGRPYSKTGVFFTAYSVLLLAVPSFFTDLGFWLSFICIAAILFIFPMLLHLCPLSRKNYLIKAVILSFSIVVATFPLNAYFFGLVTWTSLLSNILILPIFYLLMVVLLLVSFIILMWPPLGGPLLIMAKPLLFYMEKVAYYVGGISVLKWEFADFPRFWIAIYYVLLFFYCYYYTNT
ncbi:MAG: ComEC/Rec2 family competence protein [Actinomycetota bacterium]|nr:ComEC/Rec2 family competence protein [Actinomycetota bacterium]